jgi:thioredoxin-related protein
MLVAVRGIVGGDCVMKLLRPAILAATVLLAVAGSTQADEIRWRPTYRDAYEESVKTGKPMFMDFGSENCYWCKKLDATTLSDADVVKLVNERFIPVRIDATVEVELVRAVAVQALPTLFVLAPDRTILNRYEGYAEAPAILQFLRHGLERSAPPVAEKPEEK